MSAAATAAPPAELSARAAAWRVTGASVRGTAHARTGLPCQDAHAWRTLPGGTVALAAADGAGSVPHAEDGARAAAHAAVDALAQASSTAGADGEGWPAALDAALEAALRAVHAEAERLGVDVRDLSTTLIVCVAWAGGVAAAQVGDGAVVVEGEEGMRTLTVPLSGEFANETVFLTSEGAVAGAQRAAWRGAARGLAVFTDGLQGMALRLPGREPHEPFFTPLFAFARESGNAAEAGAQLAAFLAGPRVTARADDDLTLLLATREHD